MLWQFNPHLLARKSSERQKVGMFGQLALRQLLSFLGHEVSRARSYFLRMFFVYPQKRNRDFLHKSELNIISRVSEKICQLSRQSTRDLLDTLQSVSSQSLDGCCFTSLILCITNESTKKYILRALIYQDDVLQTWQNLRNLHVILKQTKWKYYRLP